MELVHSNTDGTVTIDAIKNSGRPRVFKFSNGWVAEREAMLWVYAYRGLWRSGQKLKCPCAEKLAEILRAEHRVYLEKRAMVIIEYLTQTRGE